MSAGRLTAIALTGLVTFAVALPVEAGKSKTSGYKSSSSRSHPDLARDSSGRIKRDPSVRRRFHEDNPCPSTGKTSGVRPDCVGTI